MRKNDINEPTDEANEKAAKRILDSRVRLIDVDEALKVIPGMREDLFLCAGLPINWDAMCGPVKASILGAVMYEGFASTLSEAEEYVKSGNIKFSLTHDHGCVAPMAGIISPSMPVFIVKNETFGNFSYSNINEGVGKVKTLRFGANDRSVIQRLKWIEEVLGPALKDALKITGGVNLTEIIAEALRRGDECHNRNKSATSSFFQKINLSLLETDLDKNSISSILGFIAGNVHFFLNISMATSKAAMDAAHNIEYSTIVTVMTTNGREFGIRVSGLGNEWFTAPAPRQSMGKIFNGYKKEDANPIFGDSYISECAGIGAFAMAASPAIAEFVGGTPSFGVEITKRMYKITVTEHTTFKIPYLDYRGTPTGIDLMKVITTGIVPVVDTGLAHKNAGIGQIGAGITYVPIECFKKAAEAFCIKYHMHM